MSTDNETIYLKIYSNTNKLLPYKKRKVNCYYHEESVENNKAETETWSRQ